MIGALTGLLSAGLGKLLGTVAEKTGDVISEFIEDDDLKNRLHAALTAQILQTDCSKYISQIEAQKSVLLAEINSESVLSRNWRPLVMLMFAGIICNNYIVFPYLSLFDATREHVTQLELPGFMWECLKLGLTGYIVGRSAEKIAAGSGIKGILTKIRDGN